MIEESATCVICSATLSPLERREGPVCRRQSCQWTYQAIPKQQLCRVCGRPLAMQDRAAGVCGTARCQHAAYAEDLRRTRERWEMERTTCCICHAPLSPLELGEGPVCRKQACRWSYQTVPKEHICRVCGRPLAIKDRAAGFCGVPSCQHAARAEEARQEREQRDQAARELHQRGAARSAIPEPETYPITHFPSLRRKRTRLPKKRQQAFRRHLKELIADVVAAGWDKTSDAASNADRTVRTDSTVLVIPVSTTPTAEPPAGPASELDVVSGKACTGCQGFCCLTGGTHAWLTPATIRRYHAANPGSSPAEVLDAYMALVGTRTYEGSCVYHGQRGCLLPREMRSDMCNTWFCADLRVFRAGVPPDKPVRALMVWPEGQGEFSAAFVDGGQTRPVPRKSRRKDP